MADTRTPEELRDCLSNKLRDRQADIRRLDAYYRGDHPLPWAPTEVRDAYLAFLKMARANWCRLVVKAVSERLRVVGVKFSGESSGDVDAWKRYWQGNRLDIGSRMVHDSALICRRGFTLVWPRDGELAPSITPEHPSQVIVEYKPGTQWDRVAGLKEFVDEEAGWRFATLWTPEAVYSWKAKHEKAPSRSITAASSTQPQWEPWDDPGDGIVPEAENPIGAVPLVEFVGDPSMVAEPMGELDGGVTDIQDRINKTILDRMVTSNFNSFKQKWATGLDIPKDDDGNDVEPFANAVNRMFVNENPDGRFGEFDETDLAGYLKSVEADIQHLAAITRTPPHYLLGQSGAFPSGESLKSTETGLVAKTEERRDSLTESWEETMRLALAADGDGRAEDMAMSMVWKDPESRTVAEVVDAATKLAALGVPWRHVMEFVGFDQTEIEIMDAERAVDAAQGLLAPPAPPSIGAVPQPAP